MDDNRFSDLEKQELIIDNKNKAITQYSLLSGALASIVQYRNLTKIKNNKLNKQGQIIVCFLTGCLSFTVTRVVLNTIYFSTSTI